MSLYGEAERLMRMCVDDEGNPPVSPAPELDSYLGLAQVCATLAVAGELRRLNEGRDQWYREVLEVLSTAKDPEGSLRSEQPAAAPGCRVCGNVNVDEGQVCLFDDLSRSEWLTHRQHFFEEALSFRSENGANKYADQRMRLDFGPCPEES